MQEHKTATRVTLRRVPCAEGPEILALQMLRARKARARPQHDSLPKIEAVPLFITLFAFEVGQEYVRQVS